MLITRNNVQASMADRFSRYKEEEPHIVRQFDSTATAISDLRTKRKMLRVRDPEMAKTMIEVRRDLNFFEAVELAQKEGRLIVPHDVHDRILMETEDIEFLRRLYGAVMWTGTIIIYEAPDKSFKDKVIFGWEDNNVVYSISFTVPEQFRGKINCALLVEHPDFELISLGNNNYELKVDEWNVHQIERFPTKKDGWYRYNKFRIPVGKKVAYREDNTIRYLWRDSNSYIGLLGRGYLHFGINDGRRDVGLDDLPSDRRVVALF